MKKIRFENQSATVVVIAGLLLLVVAVVLDFRNPLPQRPDFKRHATRMHDVVPIASVEAVLSEATFREMVIPTNSPSPFYTQYYQPPPPQKPPATKSVELVYQGSYESGDGHKLAFVVLGGKRATVPVGDGLLGGWFVNSIGLSALTLTNAAGESTVIEFRGKKEFKIPE